VADTNRWIDIAFDFLVLPNPQSPPLFVLCAVLYCFSLKFSEMETIESRFLPVLKCHTRLCCASLLILFFFFSLSSLSRVGNDYYGTSCHRIEEEYSFQSFFSFLLLVFVYERRHVLLLLLRKLLLFSSLFSYCFFPPRFTLASLLYHSSYSQKSYISPLDVDIRFFENCDLVDM